MLIGDGVTPGNEGRGYVLRRMLRRAVRSMRLLGFDEPSLPLLLPVSVERMKQSYPELEAGFDRITQIAYAEEEAFRRTLASGTTILDTAVARTKASGGTHARGRRRRSSSHDTYGFPIDLTLEMAEEQGLEVDREGFTRLMQEQRERAKADAKSKKGGHANTEVWRDLRALGATDWRAYQELTTEATVRRPRRRRRGASQELERGPARAGRARPHPVLRRVRWPGRRRGRHHRRRRAAQGRRRPAPGQGPRRPHRRGRRPGRCGAAPASSAEVDPEWRVSACQAHSGTHVVHAALRQVLGPTALQSGSYNKPGYLRLDFAWGQALSAETRSEIEEVANLAVRQDLPGVGAVHDRCPRPASFGALALFGETYDEQVRVIEIGGPWSRELCGGTHVGHSSPDRRAHRHR